MMITRELICRLSYDELLTRGQQLARATMHLAETDENRKVVANRVDDDEERHK